MRPTGKKPPTPDFTVKNLTASDRNSILRGYFHGAEQVVRYQDERWGEAIHFSKRYEAYAKSIIDELVKDWASAVRKFANTYARVTKDKDSRRDVMELIGRCVAATIEDDDVNGFEKYVSEDLSNARLAEAAENLFDILLYELSGEECGGGFKARTGRRGRKAVTVWTTICAERYAREGKRYSDFGD